jgi:hypothetical protein
MIYTIIFCAVVGAVIGWFVEAKCPTRTRLLLCLFYAALCVGGFFIGLGVTLALDASGYL